MRDYAGWRLGNYSLIRKIGSGTFADVYLAEELNLKTQVAVKVLKARLSDKEMQRFLEEARIVRLKHPHIISVLDFGVDQASTQQLSFIVMAYAPHGNLRQRHPKGAQTPLATIVPYVTQIADALHYLHTSGAEKQVHCDVKPENILIGANDEILLSDFGIMAISQSDSSLVPSKRDAMGTPPYMAPEQFRGEPRRASDQYALGVMVYEWLSGVRPFNGNFFQLALLHESKYTLPPPLHEKLPAIPLEVELVIMKTLAKDPDARFATVQEFAIALEKAYKETLERTMKQGDYCYKMRLYQEAITAYTHALSINPASMLILSRRGDAYRHLGKYQEALADYDSVLISHPMLAPLWNSRGAVYHLLKEYKKAIADYSQALQLDPNYKPALDNRDRAYEELENNR